MYCFIRSKSNFLIFFSLYCLPASLTGTSREVVNLSSYNYLGFAQSQGPCADAVEATTRKYGVGIASPRAEVGTLDIHLELEQLVARFLGKEEAMVVSMGYATNSTTIPALVGKV